LNVTRVLASAIALFAILSDAALAQSYPTKPIKIVVGGTPGGGADGIARLVGPKLAELLGQPVVIENRAGAGGVVGAEFVARAPADGYTLLLANQGTLTLAASVLRDIRYDPIRDFAPVGRIVHTPYFIVVNSGVPARTYRQLIDYALANPGKATYAISGEGTVGNLVLQLIKSSEDVDILSVPYKGLPQATTDLLAGRIDIMLLDTMQAQPHVQAGGMRFIAAAGRNRAASAPDVPTITEQATPGFSVEPWFGLVAPAGTPSSILAVLSASLRQIVQMPELRRHLEQAGLDVIDDTPEQFATAIRSEIDSYSATVKRARITGQP
jgi:tripartite-type tricarboxylate transporter receptor subunit TctC